MMPTIETDRLILRNFQDKDANGIFELDSDPEVMKYIGLKPITTIKEAEDTVVYIKNQFVKDGLSRWAIIEKESDEFIGWGGLKYERTIRDTPYFDLGYRLRPKFWGRGIATEVSMQSLKFGFETMGLEEICAAAHVDNIGSNMVLRKAGFQFVELFTFEDMPINWYTISSQDWSKS